MNLHVGENSSEFLDSLTIFLSQIGECFDPSDWMQVASWGAYLLSRNVLTMSFAPKDSHEAQVQFALERGVPAMIGVLASIRLPYPSRAFDMAHCSRCLIQWHLYGTSLLLSLLVHLLVSPPLPSYSVMFL